jgi:FAD/FMN-containing dehydrogenase
LLARSIDPGITYLQAFYYDLEKVEHLYRKFQPEVMMHLEFIRLNGRAIPTGIPLVRYSTAERLNQIIEYHQAHGASIANPHTYIIEEGGTIEPEQLILKQKLDPYGLLNPGKMRAWSQKV